MLRLAQSHARENPTCLRLFRRSDDMLVPSPDDDRRPVKVRPPGKLQMLDQTAADAHGSISTVGIGVSVTPES